MGNDGGSIPDRRDLVKNKPKAEQADKANQTRARWFFCALSKRKLQEPVVSCALGKLYNKDSIIEYLLDKSAYGDGEIICGHIRSLKDIKTLTLTPNPARGNTESIVANTERPQFVCPLTLKEMNGLTPFVYLITCCCVFSQAGLKNVSGIAASSPSPPPSDKDDEKEDGAKEASFELCPQCAKKYNPKEDVIPLNPSTEDEEQLRLAMDRRRALEPSKKGKKRKNANAKDEDDGPEPKKKRDFKERDRDSEKSNTPRPSMNPSISAASRAVVSSLAMEEAKRKAGMSEAVKSIYDNADREKRKETFMTMGTFTRYA